MAIKRISPPPFNRKGYIATIRSTKLKEEEGRSILTYLAEVCDDNRMLQKRKYTAKHLSKILGVHRLTVLRRMRRIQAKGLLEEATSKRRSHWQLVSEDKLQKFI